MRRGTGQKFVVPSKKRSRLSSGETREKLIEAGIDALAEQGLSVGLDAVNLEQAVRDADVPRSSAYAVWSGDDVVAPQELFQRAVLMRVLEARRTTTEQLMEQVHEFLADPPKGLSQDELRRELIRVTSTSNLRNVAESSTWQIVLAMRSIMQSAPAGNRDEDLLDWMRDNEEELRNETIERLYKPMAELFGLRPRAEFGEKAWHYGEIALSSLSEGLAMRHALDAGNYFYGLPNPDVPDRQPNWSIYSILFESIIDTFFESTDGTGD